MSPIFDVLYIAFLDRRIKSLEAYLAKNEAYQAKCRVDGQIAEITRRIAANDATFEEQADRDTWAERNTRLLAEKAALEGQRVPLPDKERKVLGKLHLYKLRRHVFEMYTERRRAIRIVNVDHLPEA